MSRPAWRNCYQTPTPETLVSEIPQELSEAFTSVRGKLTEKGFVERLEWREPPWRWCFAFTPKDAGGEDECIFLVPDPEGPRLAARLSGEKLAEQEVNSIPKVVRTALGVAPLVDGVLWPEWPAGEIEPKLDDLIRLIELSRPKRGRRKMA